MPNRVRAGLETRDKLARYQTAYSAKSRWTAEEKDAKAALLAALGYEPDDEKPIPCEVEDGEGNVVCEVKVGDRKGLDVTYLREKYPEIYAECERWTHPISIRPAPTSGTVV